MGGTGTTKDMGHSPLEFLYDYFSGQIEDGGVDSGEPRQAEGECSARLGAPWFVIVRVGGADTGDAGRPGSSAPATTNL